MEIKATVTSRSGTLTIQKLRRSEARRLSVETHIKAPYRLEYADYDSRASLVILDPDAIRGGR